MRRIFKDAYVTMVASKSSSAYSGFLDTEAKAENLMLRILSRDDHDGSNAVFFETIELYSPSTEPVNTRAWTLEERLLSPRLLMFTRQGLIWQCQERHESYEYGQDPAIGLHGGSLGRLQIPFETSDQYQPSGTKPSASINNVWLNIVGEYADRLLTRPHDKLIAVAGLAEEFAVRWGNQLGSYHAGL